jgi:hypothetical protein
MNSSEQREKLPRELDIDDMRIRNEMSVEEIMPRPVGIILNSMRSPGVNSRGLGWHV